MSLQYVPLEFTYLGGWLTRTNVWKTQTNLTQFYFFVSKIRPGFFQHFCENSSAKKTLKICPSGKNSSQFLSKNSSWGQLFSTLKKKLTQGQDFNIYKKLNIFKICPELIDWDTLQP